MDTTKEGLRLQVHHTRRSVFKNPGERMISHQSKGQQWAGEGQNAVGRGSARWDRAQRSKPTDPQTMRRQSRRIRTHAAQKGDEPERWRPEQ